MTSTNWLRELMSYASAIAGAEEGCACTLLALVGSGANEILHQSRSS
jgi:hypothetical protein